MMRIVPLDHHLLSRLAETERDPLAAELATRADFTDRAMYAASHGLAYALVDGADVPICGGIVLLRHGFAEGWMLVSREARPRHLVKAARFARDLLDRRQRDPAFRRVQAFVRTRQRWSKSFAAAIGFAKEGRHRAWDQAGRDYYSFARVRS